MDSSASGTGDDVLIYRGEAGVARLTHNGESNFIVDFYNEDGSENLVNEIRKYSGGNRDRLRSRLLTGPCRREVDR